MQNREVNHMKWEPKLYTSDGERRKQFSTWSIPKTIREEHGISDGLTVKITFILSDLEVTGRYKVTSGGEFRLPKAYSSEVEKAVLSNEKKAVLSNNIVFKIDLSEKIESDFMSQVYDSMNSNQKSRKARLKKAPKKPTTTTRSYVSFNRNPDVVAEVLLKAKGFCEICKKEAPFIKKSNNTPYLEVHHKQRLSDGGDDTVENAIALCPNCHRKQHYG